MVHGTCSVPDCTRPVYVRSWCVAHYQRWRKYGDPAYPVRRTVQNLGLPCNVAGCSRPAFLRGMCGPHYRRFKSTGTTDLSPRPRRSKGPSICKIEGCDSIVEAHGWCRVHHWHYQAHGDPLAGRFHAKAGEGWINKKGYRMVRRGKGRSRPEHCWVMEEMLGRPLMVGEEVHHINGQKADNRPQNLELWSRSHPAGQRVEDLVAWAREILARYGDDFVQPRLLL